MTNNEDQFHSEAVVTDRPSYNTADIEDFVMEGESPIQQFYRNKSIFLTGGTGFFGKVIMEKLLRTCPGVDTIYVLVRNKKGKDVQTRVDNIFEDCLFDRLKSEQPKFRHKIYPIAGDCSMRNLGISDYDETLLRERVNVVFHVAATVRFDEKMSVAMGINLSGTQSVINLCDKISNLAAFVHVSTAYANCNRHQIHEQFYKMPISGPCAMNLYENVNENVLNAMGKEMSKEWPNTYTFTKALAEDLVKHKAKHLPTAIVRPAVVLPVANEPVPGWIDNMYGPTGMLIGVAAGLIRVFHVHKDNNAEIVPVDLCVNSLLAAAWDIAKEKQRRPMIIQESSTEDAGQGHESDIPIYNFVTANRNKCSWKNYIAHAWEIGQEVPVHKSIWYISFTTTDNKLVHSLLWFLYHRLPAFFMDLGLFLLGKKTKVQEIYRKIKKYSDVIFFFTHKKFDFEHNNVPKLFDRLDERDKALFNFDMDKLDWKQYVQDNVKGIRVILMKDPLSTIPDAKKRQKMFKVVHYSILYSLYLCLAVFFFYFVMMFF